MTLSRRDFVTTTAAGVTGLFVGREHLVGAAAPPAGEDGYKLWLRYAAAGPAAAGYRQAIRQIVVEGTSRTAQVTRAELTTALAAMFGSPVLANRQAIPDGALIVGTPANSPAIRGLGWAADLAKAGPEGFVIRSAGVANHRVTAIASEGEVGALYGAFHFLRLMQTAQPIDRLERHRAAEGAAAHAQSLGQSQRDDRARLRGQLAVAVERAAGQDQPALRRLRARQRVDRHQRRGHQQRQRGRPHSCRRSTCRRSPRSPRCGGPTACACICPPNFAAPVRLGGLATADPLDKGVVALVEGQGGGDLQADSRLRRLSRQGQLRGPARAEGLRPHRTPKAPTCWPTRSRRTAATSSGARSSTTRTSIRIAPSAPTSSSRSSTDSSSRTCSSR